MKLKETYSNSSNGNFQYSGFNNKVSLWLGTTNSVCQREVYAICNSESINNKIVGPFLGKIGATQKENRKYNIKLYCVYAIIGLNTYNDVHFKYTVLWLLQNYKILSDVHNHYTDVTMSTMASQITSLMIVYSTVYSCADQRKHQSSASLAFVRVIHRWPMNSPHQRPVN